MNKKVIIDPGHGGSDSGAEYGGFMEKDWTLDISLQMSETLVELGYTVEMTRKVDQGLSPVTRSRIIRESEAALCISNHINAGGGRGTEIIMSIHRDDTLASVLLEEITQVGMERRRIFSRESNRYPGKDYYYIIRDTYPIETVIIEYGFIDNEYDRTKLKEFDFRKELAKAAARGVDNYLSPTQTIDDRSVIIVDLQGRESYFPMEKTQLINGRWYLEARALTEMAGGKVSWDSQTNKAVFDFSK